MNARILRKWSIHTKNLMSCSVCSLVVVVLLLIVTCAPSLILATMNFRSDASFAANPQHMPKNVIKETKLSSSSSSSTLLSSLLSLPNRNHRLASTSAMQVVKTTDINRDQFPAYYRNYDTDDKQRLPQIPGYIDTTTNSRSIGSSSSNSAFSSSSSISSNNSNRSRYKNSDYTKQQLHSNNDNLGYMLQLRGWPIHHTLHPMDVSSYNNNIKRTSYTDNDDIIYDNANDSTAVPRDGIIDDHNDESGNDNVYAEGDDGNNADKNRFYWRNGNRPTTSLVSLTAANQNFPVQPHQQLQLQQQPYYNSRRMEDRTLNYVIPSPLPLRETSPTESLSQLQQTPRTSSIFAAASTVAESEASALASAPASISAPSTSTSTSAHFTQPELNNHKTLKYIFSTTAHNKSEPGKDHVFDIDISNVNKIKSSALPLRFIIESYEVPASLPMARELTEQQRRMLIHEQHLRQLRTMQQQAARSRRDSRRGRYRKYENDLLTSSSSSSSSLSLSSLASSSLPSTHIQNFRKSPSQNNLRQQQHQQHQQNQQHQQRQQHQQHQQQQHQYQHQRQNQHQHQHQQRMRKHSRRYCSARDPAQLAFEAPTVFEGKIVSMTPDRRQNFSATVEVREIFKQQIGYRLQKYLRLQFAYRNNSGECDIYREQLKPRGLVRGDTIEPGRIYLLFVQQIDIGNFTILGQPIRKTKRVVETVRYAVSGNYAQLASIKSISASNRTVETGQELRIVCRVSGRPPPKVTWFKDHRSINRNRKLYQFSHYKKRSELIIRSFNTSDAGRYECRAKNKVNRNIERRAIVIKAYPVVQRFDPNPRGTGNTCPDDASEFCFNGGTCKFFSEIGSYSCICPEGFIGERCDRKEVNNMPPSTYSNEHECGENKYLGSYYC